MFNLCSMQYLYKPEYRLICYLENYKKLLILNLVFEFRSWIFFYYNFKNNLGIMFFEFQILIF